MIVELSRIVTSVNRSSSGASARPEPTTRAVAPRNSFSRNVTSLGVWRCSTAWGVTAAPITYDPPVADASELRTEQHDPEQPGGLPIVLQAEPARKLANLSRVPIALVSAPGSLLGHWGPPTVAYLRQAGCEVEDLRLAERGVEGNGHLMMLERNSREALQPILDWLEQVVPGT